MPQARARKSPKKPVRRAKQARSRATVEAIKQATTRILANDGWDSVNTNAIAESAGVSVGSVYEYFANKTAILELIVDEHLERAEALLTSSAANLADAPLEPGDVVRMLVAGYVGIHQDDPKLHRTLASSVPLSGQQQKRVNALRASAVAQVAEALAGLVPQPEIKATLLVDVADAITHRWLIDRVGVPVATGVMRQELEKMLGAYLAV